MNMRDEPVLDRGLFENYADLTACLNVQKVQVDILNRLFRFSKQLKNEEKT